ncbi:MAG: cytochrome P450 [Anaerolineae bacterium]|jgi:cytochrome P450 PksS|nr:cytochrome P450 [Anaerolineae bacterium]
MTIALDHAFFQNPYPILEQMRQTQFATAVLESGRTVPTWLITGYEDAVAFMRDSRLSKDIHRFGPGELVADGDYDIPITQNMLFRDPPDHTRLRGLIQRAFTPRMIDQLRPQILEIIKTTLNRLEGRKTFDLVQDFALPIPVAVIAELLGVPETDREKFHHWSEILIKSPVDMDELGVAALEFVMFINEFLEQKREHPTEDLTSRLIDVHEDESGGEVRRLDTEELVAMIFLLLLAGHETTVNLIGNGVFSLLQHPGQWELLQGHPEIIENAIEEMLRYESPVAVTTPRWALQDIEHRGMVIPRGHQIYISLLSANRDPAVFEQPDRFDITRPGAGKNIAFGYGIHHCLGAPLARVEGAMAVNLLLHRLPQIRLAIRPDEVQWKDAMLVRGLRALPVEI